MNKLHPNTIKELKSILSDAQGTHFSKWGTFENGRAKLLLDDLVQIITDAEARAEKRVIERLSSLEFSLPQTTYKSPFEKDAFMKGWVSAINSITNYL